MSAARTGSADVKAGSAEVKAGSAEVRASVDRVVAWLEHGRTDGLYGPDVFADLHFPHWRIQLQGSAELERLKNEMHPPGGTTTVAGVHPWARGYVLEVEERWEAQGEPWYCREAFICDLDDAGRIIELSYYCTGEWSQAKVAEHAEAVTLLRP